MTSMVEKFIKAEREMSSEKGSFLLFALFLREEAPNVWDVVVAAPWVAKDELGSLRYIWKKLQRVLHPKEVMKLSRIVPIDVDNPGLASLRRAVSVEHGSVEIKDSELFGHQIKRAYVITCRKKSVSTVRRKAVRVR